MPYVVHRARWSVALLFSFFVLLSGSRGDEVDADVAERYRQIAKPLLEAYCYDCHAYGVDEGGHGFDVLEEQGELLNNTKLWSAIIKNLRTGVMPPEEMERPSREEFQSLSDWVKRDVYQIDPEHPDPGRTVLRRLNRDEYENTIRDLLGYEFDAKFHFPPDDTGYGFDTIGEVLTVSPLLTEKYLAAAESIVDAVAPKTNRLPRERIFRGDDFVGAAASPEGADGAEQLTGRELHFDQAADLSAEVETEISGRYRVALELRVDGQFEYNPLRSNVRFFIDDEQVLDETYVYTDGESFFYDFEKEWSPGAHQLRLDVAPLPPLEGSPEGKPEAYIRLHVKSVRVVGPLAEEHWVRPPGFDLIYSRQSPPEEDAARRDYAREVLRRFATQAFRRPPDTNTVDALAEVAAAEYDRPGKTFEEGIARAMTAVLASPRFLYRIEETAYEADDKYPLLDEYSLASRLSYFLWSTMPDQELFDLAQAGRLREQLDGQIERMLADPRSEEFVENFVGQWLRSRDVAHVRINGSAVLAADLPPPTEEELAARRARGRGRFGFGFFRGPRFDFNDELRRAMQRETEMQFAYILREDRSLLELLDCDYAFLNERLAEHYGIEGVEGSEMRLVNLPPESPRGGVLTQGTLLTITSNPDRTSPVKRGLYILDNLLGAPAPPPPAAVPELEDSADKFEGRTPALREVLELHRDSPLCAACHARMDPLGLALENFNALGMWREADRLQPIDPSGRLLSGEEFKSIQELKTVLKQNKRRDFYYCITEKMLTYALGRGVEYSDADAVDRIVDQLDRHDGRFSVLLRGIIDSPQFQRRRAIDQVGRSRN